MPPPLRGGGIIIIITDLYSAFRSEDTEALEIQRRLVLAVKHCSYRGGTFL